VHQILEESVTPPTVYNYNGATGLYLGSSQARQSPLDLPGTWLYPANTTLIAPPIAGPGQAAYFSVKFGTWGLSSAKPAPPTPLAGVPSCMLWQLEAVLTPDQWSQIQTAVEAMNDPAVTAFMAHGSNFIPANSKTLIQLGAAIGITPDELTALVEKASAVVIP
jgi:hypothetical protein